jgi:hypothetical protein
MKRLPIALAVACATGLGTVPAAGEEHVTVPAPLGQQNKEAVVQPGATLKQASCGRVLQGEPAQRPARATTAPPAGSWMPSAAASGGDGYFQAPAPSSSGPTGPALVESAYLTLRGTLASFDKGAAVTIVDRNGRSRTVPLARGARVDGGLKAGDAVAVRIPLEDDPANKAANRVERQKPAAPSAPKSKFAQAQSLAPAG